MGEITGISWTDHTWNPWHGCLKVSPGCKLCYMYREKKQYGQNPMLVQRSKTKFNEPLKWNSGRVFTCSWSDFFIEEADAWRPEAWEIIRKTPQLTYQILTKRPERIAAQLPADWGNGYPNVWLGVSVESQEYANERIPILVRTPAAIRFLSAEPLLGEISLRWAHWDDWKPHPRRIESMGPGAINHLDGARMLDWVIVGGESGYGARPMFIQWAESLREQCGEAKVAFFMKQLGSANKSWSDGKREYKITGKGDNPAEWPENLRVQEFPK
jgi:protein gp37